MKPVPEDGAIFMANQSTKEECFRRKLFGLPTALSEFVLQVKRGMVLFLFDYQQRKLYGVFEASTDGGLNLVPDAYKSTNMRFPAQVRFNVVWECDPLQESDFRDVIADNYYTKNKFHFGLSRVQVDGLLFLFRQVKIQRSLTCNSKPKIQRSCTPTNRERWRSVFQRLGDKPEGMKEKSVGTSENMRYRTSQNQSAVSVASGTLKRKTGSNVKACGEDGERIARKAEKQQRKRSLKKTKTCNDLSVVPRPSHAISGGHFEISLTDQVEMVIAEYKEYLARSRREDPIENISATVENNVKLEKNLKVDVEGPPEFHST